MGAHRAALARLGVGVAVIAAASLAWLQPWNRPPVPPPPPVEIKSIQVLSPLTAFVITDPNLAYASTNGGASWRRFGVAPGAEINFVDALHGFQASERSLLATVDGGRSWQPRALPPGQRFAPAAWFLDAQRGWYLNLDYLPGTGLPRHLYRTLDGGRTWEPIWNGTSGTAQVPVFADLDHGWMAADLSLLATSDGGRTWRPVPAPRLAARAGVKLAPGALIQYSSELNEGGTINWMVTASADGGATWSRPTAVPGINILDVDFADARHWRALSRYEVWQTDDAGAGWRRVSSRLPAGAWLDRGSYLDPELGWALAGTTRTPFPSQVLRTADGGGSWTRIRGPWLG